MSPENVTSDSKHEKKKKSSPDYSAWGKSITETSLEHAPSKLDAGLYVVAVPIGNLGDITLRALDVLARVDVVLCEDTRVTGGLLHHYGIKNRLLSYHDHNAAEREPEIIKHLIMGESIALVSDAGTPLISDPGFRLVRACHAAHVHVEALPGASALLTALASSGLPTDRFLFAGFLPTKSTARKAALKDLANTAATLVFYEAPPRVAATLTAMAEIFGGEREAVVARELTKLFEEIRPAPLKELAAHYTNEPTPKGEIVIVVAPPVAGDTVVSEASVDALLKTALKTQSVRDAVAAISEATGMKKAEVYKRALDVK